MLLLIPQRYEFSSKSQLEQADIIRPDSCCWYHKGTNFQANHNAKQRWAKSKHVVADTTKVRIFKQITTLSILSLTALRLLLIPQRYEFSSKSQQVSRHQAEIKVVADTTKVRIFKQITTLPCKDVWMRLLLLIPQRYEFSSKSQLEYPYARWVLRCCWYHKGTNFQANHNYSNAKVVILFVVADTTKVRIFKQITTAKLARS